MVIHIKAPYSLEYNLERLGIDDPCGPRGSLPLNTLPPVPAVYKDPWEKLVEVRAFIDLGLPLPTDLGMWLCEAIEAATDPVTPHKTHPDKVKAFVKKLAINRDKPRGKEYAEYRASEIGERLFWLIHKDNKKTEEAINLVLAEIDEAYSRTRLQKFYDACYEKYYSTEDVTYPW